jgi:DNA-binding MarR family transcriptional regulator
VYLELVADAQTTHLEVRAEIQKEKQTNLQEQLLALLSSGTTLTRAKLRDTLSVKNERLGEALDSLEQAGRIRRTPIGWQRLD